MEEQQGWSPHGGGDSSIEYRGGHWRPCLTKLDPGVCHAEKIADNHGRTPECWSNIRPFE